MCVWVCVFVPAQVFSETFLEGKKGKKEEDLREEMGSFVDRGGDGFFVLTGLNGYCSLRVGSRCQLIPIVSTGGIYSVDCGSPRLEDQGV